MRDILGRQERANGKKRPLHQVIKGNASQKLPEFLDANLGMLITPGIFDLSAFEPTPDCFKIISSKILSGSVIAFWQFARHEITGGEKLLRRLKHWFQALNFINLRLILL